jgi:hypothetical protein
MIGGSDQQPALAGLRLHKFLRELRVLGGVARLCLKHHALARDAETLEQRRNEIGFGRAAAEFSAAAAEDDARCRITPGQIGRRRHALGGFVER